MLLPNAAALNACIVQLSTAAPCAADLSAEMEAQVVAAQTALSAALTDKLTLQKARVVGFGVLGFLKTLKILKPDPACCGATSPRSAAPLHAVRPCVAQAQCTYHSSG